MAEAAAQRPAGLSPLTALLSVCLLLVLLAATLVAAHFCAYRAFLPIEIDPNEAWNAWQSKALGHLYPAADALIINNYPPFYFYLLSAFDRHGIEPVYAGRVLSMSAGLFMTLAVYAAARALGASRIGSALGAAWFIATLSGTYTGYFGMNDPNLLALALMVFGFWWLVARQKRGRAPEPALLVMVLAGFIKHNIVALPAAAIIWLTLDSPSRALRGAAFGAAACTAGFTFCYAIFGGAFFQQLLIPRFIGWKNFHYEAESVAPLVAAIFLSGLWLLAERSKLVRKMALLLLLTGVSAFVQRLGDGVDHNAYFEFLFALAVCVGLAMSGAGELGGSPLFRSTAAVVLTVNLAITSQPEPYRYLFSEEYRAEVQENAAAARDEVERVRAIEGDVSCSVMLVCYWAGKSFVWDDFAMKERVATGQWTQAELERQAKSHGIRFETLDDRAVW
jgi:hypothetical protein